MTQTVLVPGVGWPNFHYQPRHNPRNYGKPKLSAAQIDEIEAKFARGVKKKTLCYDYGIAYETLNAALEKTGAYKPKEPS